MKTTAFDYSIDRNAPPLLTTAGQDVEAAKPARRSLFPGKRISHSDLTAFTAQLAIMLRSGVDIASSLKSFEKQCGRPELASRVSAIRQAVVGGASFSAALREHEAVFGATYVATVAAGEASGQMSHILSQLAAMQRKELRLYRSIRSLMAYPALLVAVSSLVIAALILFVLPQFAEVFTQHDTPLPLITQVLLGVSTELRARWWVYLPFAFLLSGTAIAMRYHPTCRQGWDWFLVHAWLVRDVSRALIVGRACRLMALMIDSGVPVLECLSLIREANGNSIFRNLFGDLADEVRNGRGLAERLRTAEFVPPTASEMIATAEQTGKLGEVARLIGEHFEEEGEAKMRQLVAMLEPLITVGMGIIVSIIVLGVMLPMFDLASFAE